AGRNSVPCSVRAPCETSTVSSPIQFVLSGKLSLISGKTYIDKYNQIACGCQGGTGFPCRCGRWPETKENFPLFPAISHICKETSDSFLPSGKGRGSAFLAGRKCAEESGRLWIAFGCVASLDSRDFAPDFLWLERHVEDTDAQRGQRVQCGVDDGWWRAGGAAFAYAFDAQWIDRRGRFHERGLKGGQLLG